MKSCLAIALLCAIAGCAAETSTPSEHEEQAAEEVEVTSPESETDVGVLAKRARMKCTKNGDGTETCCSKNACTTF